MADLTSADVVAFVVRRCPQQGQRAAKMTVTALRSLLGFLHLDGAIAQSLVATVPSVAGWRLSALPKALDADQIRCHLSSCDNRIPNGCRDIAVLTILVRLGLRANEVAKLALDDIDWRTGEIIVHGKANCTERLPLPRTSVKRWWRICAAAARRVPLAGRCSYALRRRIAPSVPVE